jgi:folate-dependent phosphoribosylglycinamide formyltransferase PurN
MARVAVFTRYDSSFGRRFLERLLAASVRPALLVVERIGFARRLRMARFLESKIGWSDALAYNARIWWALLRSSSQAASFDYTAHTEQVVWTTDINRPEVAACLVETPRLEWAILAHASVVRSRLLNASALRFVNAHPALLSRIRGVDVVRWSLYKQHPLVVTLHFVERGVDTGGIIRRWRDHMRPDDTISSIEVRLNDKAGELLVEFCCANSLDAEAVEQQMPEDGIQHYLMPRALRRQLDAAFPALRQYYLKKDGGRAHEQVDSRYL